MGAERYAELLQELCLVTGLGDPETVLQTRTLEVEGFTVVLDHVENDPDAMYLQFDFGTVTAGRTLVVFRLMLESNLLVYAQDQAQLGLNPDTGNVLLIVRVPLSYEIDGSWLAELLVHYTEHGRYWRDHLLKSSDEMFEGLGAGQYMWIRG
ncbi:CesT family type III secretion system chaperone [Caldimonas brevitalea]|uniref:Molecular chaperone Tir n=1 Tax=Caldimonas brevitalea TaxID=413882 RepID=A0A0G3BKC6_9BURK|nr:CesT family type III secretion system chaperone [Caldimonas brevitalea]AKJ27811.1 molecular chaperone Tir [Caldimonas brevitalea]